MSLLIKGIDMPNACIKCGLRDDVWGSYKCTVSSKIIKNELDRPNDCPLVEIPTPHGRLIDADAHIQSLKENQCGERCRKNHDCVNCGIGMYIRIVENEPTIIEAEGKS